MNLPGWRPVRRLFELRPAVDVSDEVRAHLEMRADELVAEGWDELDARREAERLFGDSDGHTKAMRREAEHRRRRDRRNQTVGDMGGDLRHGARALRRNLGFTLTAVATLALGTGSVSAVFGMANQLLLRPILGVPNSQTAWHLQFRVPENDTYLSGEGVNTLDFDRIRRETSLLEGLASYGNMSIALSPTGSRPTEVWARWIYGDFFEILGTRASAGRMLSRADTDLSADPRIAVISESLRDRLFSPGTDPIGRSVPMNGEPVTIVGVAAGGFRGIEPSIETDIWLPYGSLVPLVRFPTDRLTDPGATMHEDFIGLARAGATPEAVESEMASVLARLESRVEREMARWRPTVWEGLKGQPVIRELTTRTLRLMWWSAGLVLLIACANVANLLLLRSFDLRPDLAVRRAFGAPWIRLARQRFVESMQIGLLGAVVGLVVAWLVLLPFRGMSLARMPAIETFVFDWRLGAFVFATALGTTVIFGGLPAFFSTRTDIFLSLRESGSRDTGRFGFGRSMLASAQVALTLGILIGGVLMARSLDNIFSTDTGMELAGVAQLGLNRSSEMEPEEARALQGELLATVRSLPGVIGAALDVYGPQAGSSIRTTFVRADDPDSQEYSATYWPVSPGWFELLGVEVLAGRTFVDSDWSHDGTGAVVLSASMAERVFGRQDVVGTALTTRPRDEYLTVVGVVEDYRSLRSPEAPVDIVYVNYGQVSFPYVSLLFRAEPYDRETASRVVGVTESLNPDVPVPDPITLEDRIAGIQQERRMLGRLLWILSAFGLTMSAVGVYGVIAYVASRRRREFALRMALGAREAQVFRHVVASGAWIAGLGTATGFLCAYAVSRIMESRLFGVGPFDLPAYGLAAMALAAVTLVAMSVPAYTATTVDPMETLREE